jgi:hypothetical protein
VGVPGLFTYFKPQIAQNPKTAIPLLILWELLVLVAGLVTDVWSKLRSRWVDRLVDPVDHAIQAVVSRYHRHYLKWIFYLLPNGELRSTPSSRMDPSPQIPIDSA